MLVASMMNSGDSWVILLLPLSFVYIILLVTMSPNTQVCGLKPKGSTLFKVYSPNIEDKNKIILLCPIEGTQKS